MRTPPSFESTTRLVSRAVGIDAEALVTGLRRAESDDLDAIVAFRAHNFDDPLQGDDAAYLRWRYRLGRPGCGLGDLWLLRVDGRLLGVIGTEDLAIRHAGTRHAGIRMMDLLVDRDAQSRGLGVWMNQALFRAATFVIVVGANERSIGIVKSLFTALPDMQSWMLPTDIGWKLRAKWGDGVPASAAAAVGNRLLKLRRNLHRLGEGAGWQVRPVERFDESFDALLAPESDTGVALERARGYLNHRLLENPRARYKAVALQREGELVGYIAWRKVERGREGSWLHVIDWRVGKTWLEEGAMRLLAHVTEDAERERCNYVLHARQGASGDALLKRAGFLGPRRGREIVVGVHAEDPALHAALAAADWSLTELDNDVEGT